MFHVEYNFPIDGKDIYRKSYKHQEEIENKDDIDILQIYHLNNVNIMIDYKNITELELDNCDNCIIILKNFDKLQSLYINNCKDCNITIENINLILSINILSCNINELTIKNGTYEFQIENTKINYLKFDNVKLISSEIIR